jgi:tetratricopeptide (TPR) repeat protein
MDLKANMKQIACIVLILLSLVSIFSCSRKILPPEVSRGKGNIFDSAAFDYVFIEAVKQKLMGNPGDAMKYFEQCQRINPKSDGTYYQIAQLLLAGGDLKNAKIYLLKAHNLDNSNLWYLMMLAGTYYQERNLDSAILFYEKAVKNFPDKENLKLTLGNLYSEDKKYERAGQIFEDLNIKYGVNEASTVASVKNYIEAKEYDKALNEAMTLTKKFPDNIIYNGLLAEIYSGKGDKQKAADVYDELMKNNPGNPEIQLGLCEFQLKQKNYEDLLSLLNIVVINSAISEEQKMQLFTELFEDNEMVGKYGERLILPIIVLEATDEKNVLIRLIRPALLTKLKKWNEAAGILEEIIKIDTENYYVWEKLLLLYFEAGNFKKLQERGADCALKFNRSFMAKMLYAMGAGENGDYNTAMEELKKASILAGNNKDLLLQVLTIEADIYYKMKDYDKAFKTFDEAISTNNSDITLLNNYAYYLAEQNLRLKEAEKMSKEVIEKENNNATFLDTYGWVLYKRGKINEAEKVFEKILNSGNKPDAEWYEHYGYIMRRKRDCKKAIENWNIAIKLDSSKTNLINEIEKCKK